MITIKSDNQIANSVLVTTDNGHELTGITRIEINITPMDQITARLTFLVSEFKLQGVPLVDTHTLRDLAKDCGYDLVKR